MSVRNRRVSFVRSFFLVALFLGAHSLPPTLAQPRGELAPDPGSQAIARLLAEVRDPDGKRCWIAARELAERSGGRAALEALLYEPNERVRTIAGETLLAVVPEYAVGAMLRATASDEPDARLWASTRLERIDAAALEPFLADFDAWLDAASDASVWVPLVRRNENALRTAWKRGEGESRRRAGVALALCPRVDPTDGLAATFLEALGHREARVRRGTAKALAIQRHRAWLERDDLVAAIHEATRDPDAVVREFACRALGPTRIGRIGAIDVLRDRLEEPSPEVRVAAIEAIRDVVRPIRRIDRASEAELQDEAAVRPREDAWLADVIDAVDTLDDPELRHDAVAVLGEWGLPFGRAYDLASVRATESFESSARGMAERRLVAAFERWLDDPELDVAVRAADALAERGIPAFDAAVRARLITRARSADARDRTIAGHGLRGVAGAAFEEGRRDVAALYESSEGPTRSIAWILLGDARPTLEVADRDDFLEVLESVVEHEALRSDGLSALATSGPEVVVPFGRSILEKDDASSGMRRLAIDALQRMGPAASHAAPLLRERLARGEARADILIADALQEIDSSPRERLASWIALAESCLDGGVKARPRASDTRLRFDLDVEGLERILEEWSQKSGRLDPNPLLAVVRGARSLEVGERLHVALRGSDARVATFAAIALASSYQVGEGARSEAFDRLAESIDPPHPLVRRAVVRALSSFGRRPFDEGRFVSALLAASADPDAEVRGYAMHDVNLAKRCPERSNEVCTAMIERCSEDPSRSHRERACRIICRTPFDAGRAVEIARGWENESDRYRSQALSYLGSASHLRNELVEAYARLLRTGADTDVGSLVPGSKWGESLEPASIERIVDVLLREAFEREPTSNRLIMAAQRLTTDVERILPELRRAAESDERIAFVTRPYIESVDPAARVARRAVSGFDPGMEHPSIRAFEEYRFDPAALAVWCIRSEGDRRRRAIEWLGNTRTRLARAVLPELADRFLGAEDEAIERARAVAEGRDAPPDVEKLIERLRSENNAARSRAAEASGAMGERGAPAIPSLIEALASSDAGAREAAADALVRIGAPSIPALLEAVGDVRFPHPGAAAAALDRLAPLPVGAVDVLVDEYRNSTPDRREMLAERLIASGDDGLHWLIAHEAVDIRLHRILGAFARRDPPQFVERLGSVLVDPSWSTAVQRSVVDAFAACHFGGIDPLAARLDDVRPGDDPELLRAILRTIRHHAFRKSASDGPGSAPFERGTWPAELEYDVALTRAAFGVATPEVTNTVARALDSDDPVIRLDATKALARVGRPAEESLVELASAQLVGRIGVTGAPRALMSEALEALGPSAVDALLAKLDADLEEFEEAGRPILPLARRRSMERTVEAIGKAAGSNEESVRRVIPSLVHAIRLDESFSRPAWDALVELTRALPILENDDVWTRLVGGLDDESRGYLAMAVVSRSHRAREYPRAIVEGLADAVAIESIRAGALQTLGRLQDHASLAVPALLRLDPRDGEEAVSIVSTIRSIATTDSRVFDTLFGRLGDPRWSEAIAIEFPGWIRSSLEAHRVTRRAIELARTPQASVPVRIAIVRLVFGLGRSGDLADETWVQGLFDHESVLVRRSVIEACKKSRRRWQSDLLYANDGAIWRRALRDEDAHVRAAAVGFAAEASRRNVFDSRDILAVALVDPAPEVLVAALDVVRGLRERTSRQLDLALSLVEHPSADVRESLARALERFDFGRDRVDRALERLAADTNPSVAKSAAAAVGHRE